MKKLVLLIDSDTNSISEVRRQLTKIDYNDETILVCTDFSTLNSIDPDQIGIILLSYVLKGFSFDQALKSVRKKFPYKPILVLVNSDDKVGDSVIEQGVEDYLLKGEFDEKTLEKAIRYALTYKRFSTDYKRLFDENPGPMYIYDHQTYKFLGVNEAALAQYGYSREEFLSLNAREIRPPGTIEAFETANNNRPEAYFDYGRWQHLRKNGEAFFVHIYAHTVEFEGKSARLVFAANIDKKVRAEMALIEKNEEIEKQNEQLRKIAWINSHEIRSPVAAILGLVQLFNTEDAADPVNIEIVSQIQEATTKLDIVIQTLDFHARSKGWDKARQ
jgi:PAS domain S-box-containing protein